MLHGLPYLCLVLATIVTAGNAQNCPAFWPTTLSIPQVVPAHPSRNARREWAMSLCGQTSNSNCPYNGQAYIFGIDPDKFVCTVSFGMDLGHGVWEPRYGGINNMFVDTQLVENAPIANVTLVCNMSAADEPWPIGDVEVRYSDNTTFYDFRIATIQACLVPPPGPTLKPAPTAAPAPSISGCPLENTANVKLPLVVPSNRSMDGERSWQLTVCYPSGSQLCMGTPKSYAIELGDNGFTCLQGFNEDLSDGIWRKRYGGVNSFFSGTLTADNDRILNLTLVCDRHADTARHESPVIAHSFDDGAIWQYDMRLLTLQACYV